MTKGLLLGYHPPPLMGAAKIEAAHYRFALKPSQSVQEHTAPNSPVHIVVLKGEGLSSGGDSQEECFGPGALLIFDTGEPHAIRADGAELVFVAFLHGVPEAPWHR